MNMIIKHGKTVSQKEPTANRELSDQSLLCVNCLRSCGIILSQMVTGVKQTNYLWIVMCGYGVLQRTPHFLWVYFTALQTLKLHRRKHRLYITITLFRFHFDMFNSPRKGVKYL